MVRRLPGKKLKTHTFIVDGVPVNIDIRVTDNNRFWAEHGEAVFERATFAELAADLKPFLERMYRLEYEPMIDVDHLRAAENSWGHNHRDTDCHQEVRLAFKAGWASKTPATTAEDRRVEYRWIPTAVDPETCEIAPASQHRKSYADRISKDSHDALIPFTPDRWRRLGAIADALVSVRARIAEVLEDATGAKLEALGLAEAFGVAAVTALKLLDAPVTKKAVR